MDLVWTAEYTTYCTSEGTLNLQHNECTILGQRKLPNLIHRMVESAMGGQGRPGNNVPNWFFFREKLIPSRRDPLIVVHMWSTCSWAPAHRASGNGFKTSCFIYIMIFALYIYRCKNTSASQPWCFFKSRSAQVYLDWCQIQASCQDLEL